MPVLFGGRNLPLVEIGLTDVLKSVRARDDRPVEDTIFFLTNFVKLFARIVHNSNTSFLRLLGTFRGIALKETHQTSI